jgi:hypothetical protein
MRRWKLLQEWGLHFELEKPNEAIYGLTGSGTICPDSIGEVLSLHRIVKLALLIRYYRRRVFILIAGNFQDCALDDIGPVLVLHGFYDTLMPKP